MMSQLKALSARAAKGGEPVSVLLLDLDHFKQVNDGYGHDAGDDVLREFAVRLATNVRAIDLPCRYGGEEFVIVMPGASLTDAERVAERIRLHVNQAPIQVCGGKARLGVTISIGVASSLGEGDTPDLLLKRADEALYAAKTGGRNRVVAHAA
jgi:two-component system cell cycle response regulator